MPKIQHTVQAIQANWMYEGKNNQKGKLTIEILSSCHKAGNKYPCCEEIKMIKC